jgi:hypothetical protein
MVVASKVSLVIMTLSQLQIDMFNRGHCGGKFLRFRGWMSLWLFVRLSGFGHLVKISLVHLGRESKGEYPKFLSSNSLDTLFDVMGLKGAMVKRAKPNGPTCCPLAMEYFTLLV